MNIQEITKFKTSQWAGGTTTELFIYPTGSSYLKRDFLFRLSSATVVSETSEFSDLTGFQRFISPLEGELHISHNDTDFKTLSINEIYYFDGGIKTTSKGKCRDFNVMLKNKRRARVECVEINTDDVLRIKKTKHDFIWIFSYNNNGVINLNINKKTIESELLDAVKLYLFIQEDGDADENEIIISANQKTTLFYGKIYHLY